MVGLMVISFAVRTHEEPGPFFDLTPHLLGDKTVSDISGI